MTDREYTWSWPGHLTFDGKPGYGYPVKTRLEAAAEGDGSCIVVSRLVGTEEWAADDES